ncbi:MAG: ASKHA domain-containing protein, partial [Ignavibacteria bacterium]|nr:ASKHA domain-containing protein [Ignavibacteria bacterium]
MSSAVHIRLVPLGVDLHVTIDTPLQDILFQHGVEFPCGGKGRCKGCRVRVLEGTLPVTEEERHQLTEEERLSGWRLSCRHTAQGDLALHVAQWESAILADDSLFTFTPRTGLGIAVDIGSTTLVAQLIDLGTGTVRAVNTALNHQARHGADVMSRVGFAVTQEGRKTLVDLIRRQILTMIEKLLDTSLSARDELADIVLVGNTVMHHLFCDFDLEPLSRYPFASPHLGSWEGTPGQLGWEISSQAVVRVLPCIGGFVGSDILAGIMATRIHESEKLTGLIDLGTNGEIVIGNRERLLCCSTAAGPAFEGARISLGMRAATGAISRVGIHEGQLTAHVVGEGSVPRGICGSGLVDAVACALDLELVQSSGRIPRPPHRLDLLDPVHLTQTDIRELQLAKAAIAAGTRILLRELGATEDDIDRVHLAGAFGNYISVASARRIGLIHIAVDRVHPAGNT